jgi:rare lipoprotein A
MTGRARSRSAGPRSTSPGYSAAAASALVCLLATTGACGTTKPLEVQRGKASFYADRFHGRKTASGERFDTQQMTAAHRRLPFGTLVRVVNLENGRAVVVRINDRGPYARGRIIDLSPAAARVIDMVRAGIVPVRVEVLILPERCGRKRRC